jgi:hypothetical protein
MTLSNIKIIVRFFKKCSVTLKKVNSNRFSGLRTFSNYGPEGFIHFSASHLVKKLLLKNIIEEKKCRWNFSKKKQRKLFQEDDQLKIQILTIQSGYSQSIVRKMYDKTHDRCDLNIKY